jgi:hypothetical protein
MQTAKRNYTPEITSHMGYSLTRMPVELPISVHEIACYVEKLLTPGEQEACERATD